MHVLTWALWSFQHLRYQLLTNTLKLLYWLAVCSLQPCGKTTYTDPQVDDHGLTFLLIPVSWNHTPVKQHILVCTKFKYSSLRRSWRIRSSMARNTLCVMALTSVKPPPVSCSYPVLWFIFNISASSTRSNKHSSARSGCADFRSLVPTAPILQRNE